MLTEKTYIHIYWIHSAPVFWCQPPSSPISEVKLLSRVRLFATLSRCIDGFHKTTLKEKVEFILRTERWKVLAFCCYKCTVCGTCPESQVSIISQLFTNVIREEKAFDRGGVEHVKYKSFTQWFSIKVSELNYYCINSFIEKKNVHFSCPPPLPLERHLDASKP